ncbi:MAG: type II toxin-antitoxin system PemK/MazF family toxin, partial [Planctomycetaceae bacterium]
NDRYHRANSDMVVVAMTSTPQINKYGLGITSKDLSGGTLNRPGTVRVDKIYTLSRSLVAKVFGRVNDTTLERIRALLADLVAKK